jgi:hypothetical protein
MTLFYLIDCLIELMEEDGWWTAVFGQTSPPSLALRYFPLTGFVKTWGSQL